MIVRSQNWQALGLNLALMRNCSIKITTKQTDIRMSDFFLNCMRMGSSQILVKEKKKKDNSKKYVYVIKGR